MPTAFLVTPLLVLASLGRAFPSETIPRFSVEWLTSESSLIFTGTTLDRSAAPGSSGYWVTRERYRLDDVLKGPLSDGDTVTLFRFQSEEPSDAWLRDRSRRLEFCKVARTSLREIEGKYTGAAPRALPSSFPEGEALGVLSRREWWDGYFSPEIQPVTRYEELYGRARRHVAWERRVRSWSHELDVLVVEREPRPTASGEFGSTRGQSSQGAHPPVLISEGSSLGVLWPQLRGRLGQPLLRWPEERNRAPARFTVLDEEIAFVPMKVGQRPFSNRRYVWSPFPEHLRGWTHSQNIGGEARAIEASVTVSGHVFMAVSEDQANDLGSSGWSPAGMHGDLDLGYSDRGRTRMKVLSRYFASGEKVTFPAVGWTGAVVLVPPDWL